MKIRGGVSYFLWDREHNGGCTIQTVRGDKVGEPMTRNLDDYDVFVRFNEGVSILEKVRAKADPSMDRRVSSLVPFGLRANFRDYVEPESPGLDQAARHGAEDRVDRPEVGHEQPAMGAAMEDASPCRLRRGQ